MLSGDRRTAFVESARELGRQLEVAGVDHAAFARPMRRCELARCRATCCHDGVVVGSEEVGVIDDVVSSARGRLGDYGWKVPAAGTFCITGDGKRRTVTCPASAGELADDFAPHFPRTRCVFLDDGHRCVLQRLAVDRGRHPWFWKPLSCWMHPLVLRPAGVPGGRPLLTVPGGDDDGRFVACTPCGRREPEGEPAAVVLAPELVMLGALAGRDFVRAVGVG